MSEWRRVQIVGTCANEHVPALREHLAADIMDKRWGCLHNGGIVGLPNWAGPDFNAVGNLGERGYDEQSVAAALRECQKVAPSLSCSVHVGEVGEGDTCVASVFCVAGRVMVDRPLVATIPQQDPGTARANLLTLSRR